MLRAVFILPLFLIFHFADAQIQLGADELKYFSTCEDTLSKLIRLSVKAKNDAEKLEINSHFSKLMDEVLNTERSFAFPFDSLKKFKMMITSADNELRIVTWNIPMDDKTQRFFGYVQHLDQNPAKNGADKKWQLFKLEDKSDEIKNPENASLTNEKWFGCYYYKIIDPLSKKKKQYTLLAWDGNSRVTQKKLIDVLSFNSAGEPQFGDAIFEVHKLIGKTDKEITVWQKRVIFEFKQGVTMSLKYDESSGQIIYDHLSPEESAQRGQFQYYGPDLSLDALKFKKGKWHCLEALELNDKNQNGRNDKNKTDKLYNSPPQDPNSPSKK